jgi:hypothetical protein
LASKAQGKYFKMLQKNQGAGLYPHTDNEDAMDYAHAEMLAESLMHHQEEVEGTETTQARQMHQLDVDPNQSQPTVSPHLQAMTNAIENVEDLMSRGTTEAGNPSPKKAPEMQLLTSPANDSPTNLHVQAATRLPIKSNF